MLARVLGLAQTVEVFFTSYGVTTAHDMARARRGMWLDPDLVDALTSMESDSGFWRRLGGLDHADTLRAVEPADRVIVAGEADIDRVAEAFARVIDAESPWTYQHSSGVAAIAVAVGERLGYGRVALRELRRSALLHDLGKLGVSNVACPNRRCRPARASCAWPTFSARCAARGRIVPACPSSGCSTSWAARSARHWTRRASSAQSCCGRSGDRGTAGGTGGAPRVFARRGLLPGRLTRSSRVVTMGLRFPSPVLDEMVQRPSSVWVL